MQIMSNTSQDESSNNGATPRPSRSTQYFATLAATMGAMGIGTLMGYTSPAGALLLAPNKSISWLPLTKPQYDWFSSAPFLGAAGGGLLGGIAITKLGRRTTLMVTVFLFLGSWVLVGAAQDFIMLLSGRLLAGLCVGINALAAPTYVAEIASPDIRGTLGSVFQLMITVGMVFGLAVGIFVTNWRTLAIICGVPPLVQLVMLWFTKESPVYFMMKGKSEKVTMTLQYFRGVHYDIRQEMNDLLQEHESIKTKASVLDLFKANNLKPFLICLSVCMFTQLSGIGPVISNLSVIFKEAGSGLNDNVSATIVGAVQMMATLLAVFLVDRAGRTVLLVTSSSTMALALVAMAEYFVVKDLNAQWTDQYLGWLPLLSLVVFIAAFSLGFGPITWLLMSELFSPSVRETAASLVCCINWLAAFGLTLAFQPLQDLLGESGLYLLLASCCTAALAFSAWVVPETKGLTLQQISAYFNKT